MLCCRHTKRGKWQRRKLIITINIKLPRATTNYFSIFTPLSSRVTISHSTRNFHFNYWMRSTASPNSFNTKRRLYDPPTSETHAFLPINKKGGGIFVDMFTLGGPECRGTDRRKDRAGASKITEGLCCDDGGKTSLNSRIDNVAF